VREQVVGIVTSGLEVVARRGWGAPGRCTRVGTARELEESLLEFPGALVLVTHDRHLIDRVSTTILSLDGKGGAERFADYGQWEADRRSPVASSKATGRATNAPAASSAKSKRLSYNEQREWDGMEAIVLSTEARLEEARSRVEDPSIASDAAALQVRITELDSVQRDVDRLYARWAGLEATRS
jgi:ATP-binding cassette subfamily F protein uup